MLIGDVEIGAQTSIWYGCVVRADVHRIRVGARSNLQDHCIVHVTRDRFAAEIGDEVTAGHRAIIHGCQVRDGALIGIGAIVLDGAVVGEGAWVGAGAVVTPGSRIPDRTLALGTPARVIRAVSDEERAQQRELTLEYVKTALGHAAADPTP